MKSKIIKLPFGAGRIVLAHELEGSATHLGGIKFGTNLRANQIRDGRVIGERNLGSGLVTNVGVLALANDFGWSATNALNSLFAKMKYHASGKGTTSAAETDIKLETVSTVGGQTPVAGTQVLVSAANAQKYQSVATIAYTGAEAVTEWGFLAYGSTLPAVADLSDATGSPFTAGGATSGTTTGTTLTASSATVMGQQMSIFERTSGTNLSYGLVTSNTTSVITVPAWYLVATGAAGQAPGNAETYVIRPIMWDHKVFSAINVVNGDSIQYTYTLTISSGG
ncbi:MAG: hypothetical protein Q8R92_19810 [Deltaproteobacteria bacterium]|nr:hypothetical protein [Deltaproteobacteria bacterium]